MRAVIRSEVLWLGCLLGLVYTNILRAYTFDTINYVVLFTVLIFILSLNKKTMRVGLPRGQGTLFAMLFFIMLLHAVNYTGDRLYQNLFLYFMTPFIYFAFYYLLVDKGILNIIYKFFMIMFVFESAFIIFEVVDSFLGVDIHRSRLINWYLTTDFGRFEFIGTGNSGSTLLDLIPLALGIHGFPNYTAPLYAVSTIICIVGAYNKDIGIEKKYLPFLVLTVGVCCVLLLGVKTHMISIFISLVICGFYVDKRIFLHSFMLIIVLVLFVMQSDWAQMRIDNYYEQLFVGGLRWEYGLQVEEAGRIETILLNSDYLVFLEMSLSESLLGTDFKKYSSFGLFENKGLVYTIRFGILYMITIFSLIFLAIKDCRYVNKYSNDFRIRSLSVAIGCGILILILETGHFGFTFNYPNYQILFLLLAISAVLKRQVRMTKNIILSKPYLGNRA